MLYTVYSPCVIFILKYFYFEMPSAREHRMSTQNDVMAWAGAVERFSEEVTFLSLDF